jgi:hypothetical protein
MALTLSKTNIENGNIIQAADVSQSIDAFTGAVAYDITLSGSLQLTGSVKSKDGYTGSLQGTASFVVSSSYALSSSFSQTASFVTLAQTASFVTLAQTASFATTAQTASFVPLAINNVSTTDATITFTSFNSVSSSFTINNVTSSISSSLATTALSAKRLTADSVRIRSSGNPPQIPYVIDQSTPAMVYLEFPGVSTSIGLELRTGTLGQIVTFNPYTTEVDITTAQISITGSTAGAFGLGSTIIYPSGGAGSSSGSLDNLFNPATVPLLYSFSLQYTTLTAGTGWYLVNVSKA